MESEKERNHYSVHRLVQLVTYRSLEVYVELNIWRAQAVVTVTGLIPDCSYETLAVCERSHTHVVAVTPYESSIDHGTPYAAEKI